jgi:hypothetical protein
MRNFQNTELTNGQPQIQLSIPQDIDYNSQDLFDTPVERFDRTCLEMKMGDGTPFLDKIRKQLVGESLCATCTYEIYSP